MQGDLSLLLPVAAPLAAGLLVLFVRAFDERRTRNLFTGAALALTVLLTLPTLLRGETQLTLFHLTDTIPVVLRTDGVARLFLVLIAFVWAMVGFYSFEYMAHEQHERRFYGFYLLTLAALMGLSLSGTLVTLYMFYEAMTLLSLPLVLHTQTREAVAAGVKYLLYSVFGASLALLGIFFLQFYCTSLSFTPGGTLDALKAAGHEPLLLGIVALALLGFGVKAGMFPLHAWLPTAHPVAPSPASAVLSGIITKAGVLGILRIVFFLVGPDFLRGTWVQALFLGLTVLTVFLGSMLAFKETLLKKRLAYSTVSQVSYVLFGLFTLTPVGFVGALLHVVCHALIKNTLFMGAGAIIEKTGKTRVDELVGIGKRMPIVMWCFTLCAVALIGIPPTGGFVSKWFLAEGALSMGGIVYAWLGPAVLLVSALLTAGYLLPISTRGFFPGEHADLAALSKAEPTALMTVPMLVLAALCVLLGMFPGALTSFLQAIAGGVL